MQFVLGGLESRVLVFYTMLHALNPQSLERICYLQNIRCATEQGPGGRSS